MVPIRVEGGAITLRLHRPRGSEAFVHVSGGAVNLTADGRELHGVGDETWQSAGYDRAADAYRAEINGGASNVTLDTTPALKKWPARFQAPVPVPLVSPGVKPPEPTPPGDGSE